MFYQTTDRALDRWTDADGNEYAYAYDDYAECPLDWGYDGVFITSCDSRRAEAGDKSLRRALEAWEDDRDQFESNMEYAETSEEAEEAQEELLDHLDSRPSVERFDAKGYTVYFAPEVVAKVWGHDPEDLDDMCGHLEMFLEDFDAWAEGQVFIGGVTTLDGEEHFLGGIYLDDTQMDRPQIEEIMSDFV